MATGRGLAPQRVYRVEAVVLKRLSIGETDRVVTLFTRDRGKLSAVAKGARGPRSRLAGVTEPFTYFNGLLSQGQTLDVLTQAEVQQSFSGIRKDLTRIGYASYFTELTDAGIEERQPLPALWDLLIAALATLDEATTPDVLARAFELHAMSLIGYEPHLDRCVLDDQELNPEETAFHPLRGGMLCPCCARSVAGRIPIHAETYRALQSLATRPFVEAAHAAFTDRTRGELTRCLIPYVRHHLETPLRSLQFLDDVTREPDRPL